LPSGDTAPKEVTKNATHLVVQQISRPFAARFIDDSWIHPKAWDLIQDGAPKIAKLPYKWLNLMVVIMVYKPTYNWGAPSCRMLMDFLRIVEGMLW
jgi:hypothetical protein